MILYGDYHVHSVYSDGKSTLQQNVQSAYNKGLKQIALTEHGFRHTLNGMRRKKVPEYIAEIKRLRKSYKTIDILYGMEANILDLNGRIDLTPAQQNELDVIIVGYHKSYMPTSIKNFFNFFVPNTVGAFRKTKSRIEKNTKAYINAIKNNKIDILAHLNYGGCWVDCVEVAKVAKEYGVYIELNGKRILFTDQEILDMQKTGVKFIINSDAHLCQNIGKNNKAFTLIERLGIPHEQIANLDKIPTFKNYNTK